MGSQKIDPRNKVKLPLQRKGYKIREQYESKQGSLRRKKREAMAKNRKKSPQLLLQENTAMLRENLMKTAGNAMKRSNAVVNTNHGPIIKNTNLNKSPNKAKVNFQLALDFCHFVSLTANYVSVLVFYYSDH